VTDFYDSTNLAELAAAGADHVCLYGDGVFDQSGRPLARTFKYRRWITVAGLETCGIADYEPGNPVFEHAGELRRWALARHARESWPIVYTDRANAAAAMAEVHGLACYYWVSIIDPADRPAQHPVTALELSSDLTGNWHAPIPAPLLWGCQWDNQPGWDRSDLFGDWWA